MWGQPGLYSESQANLVYRIRPCLTKQNTHIVQHTNNKNKANSQSQKRKHLPALSPLHDQKERNYKQSTNNVYYIRSHWRKEVSSMGTLPPTLSYRGDRGGPSSTVHSPTGPLSAVPSYTFPPHHQLSCWHESEMRELSQLWARVSTKQKRKMIFWNVRLSHRN